MKKLLLIIMGLLTFVASDAGNKVFYLQGNAAGNKVIATQDARVSVHIPELCGMVQFGIIKGGANEQSLWLKDAKTMNAKMKDGVLTYIVKDPLLGNGTVTLRMKPMKNTSGFLIEMTYQGCPADVSLLWCYGGASNRTVKDAEGCSLLPEYCKENILSVERTAFTNYFGEAGHFRVFSGITPLASDIRLCDARQQQSPLTFFNSGKRTDAMALGGVLPLNASVSQNGSILQNGEAAYFAFFAPARGCDYNYFMLSKLFNE